MSVLITSIQGIEPNVGDQIIAYSLDGMLVGAGTFILHPSSFILQNRCGLAVWGDDPSTDEVDGLLSGEAFELRFWDSELEEEEIVNCQLTIDNCPLVYETDGLVVLDVAIESAVPEEFYLSEAYPNPFNAVVRLSYGLPDAAMVSIRVYDVSGRLVETLLDKNQVAGYHTLQWNTAGGDAYPTASGIYFVVMVSGDFKVVRKVMLVK